MAPRLRFALSKGSVDHILGDLRKANQDFQTLSRQINQKKQLGKAMEGASPESCACEVERYRLTRKAAWQAYEALSNACNKCNEHLAFFGTEAQLNLTNKSHDIIIKFFIAFTIRDSLISSTLKPSLWFTIEAISSAATLSGTLSGVLCGQPYYAQEKHFLSAPSKEQHQCKCSPTKDYLAVNLLLGNDYRYRRNDEQLSSKQ